MAIKIYQKNSKEIIALNTFEAVRLRPTMYLFKTYKEEILEKEKYTKLQGFNYILILERDYREFENLIYEFKDKV